MRELFQVQRPPATPSEVEALRRWLGRELPLRYLAFLREANGAELGVHDEGGDCLVLWSTAELPELNQTYGIARWRPGGLAIGSDGGDEAILLDMSGSADPEAWPVIRQGFGALGSEESFLLAPSFAAWADLEFRLGRSR